MTRVIIATVMIAGLLISCSGSDEETQTTAQATSQPSQAKRVLDRASAVSERPVGKQELLGLLSSAGLDHSERPAGHITDEMRQALPGEPRDQFMLGVQGQDMIAFEFSSVAMAAQMEAAHGNGFRYRNWYFGGPVSAGVTNQMKSAFQ